MHIQTYIVDCDSFNADPQRYMVDAEGNYRMDSVGWGVCVSEEPDLSGKAYWVLKDYLANGYGSLTWNLDGKTGTNNFYLSGTGNFLMNQIGHLPKNSASILESFLFSNSVFYVSQRKQCEVCAANQHGQESMLSRTCPAFSTHRPATAY